RAEWELSVEGRVLGRRRLPFPDVEPYRLVKVAVPGLAEALAEAPDLGERLLTVYFMTADESYWAPTGFEVAACQVSLGGARASGNVAQATGSEIELDGDSLPELGVAAGPRLALWRAP